MTAADLKIVLQRLNTLVPLPPELKKTHGIVLNGDDLIELLVWQKTHADPKAPGPQWILRRFVYEDGDDLLTVIEQVTGLLLMMPVQKLDPPRKPVPKKTPTDTAPFPSGGMD